MSRGSFDATHRMVEDAVAREYFKASYRKILTEKFVFKTIINLLLKIQKAVAVSTTAGTVPEEVVIPESSSVSNTENSSTIEKDQDDSETTRAPFDDSYPGMTKAEIKARKKAQRMGYRRYMRKKMLGENDSSPDWVMPQDFEVKSQNSSEVASVVSYLENMIGQHGATVGGDDHTWVMTTTNPPAANSSLGMVSVAGFLAIFGSAMAGKYKYIFLQRVNIL